MTNPVNLEESLEKNLNKNGSESKKNQPSEGLSDGMVWPNRNSSVAVMQQGGSPVQLQKLKVNTDLTQHPLNWFQSNYSVRLTQQPQPKDFLSFHLAKEYLNYIGKVDVVSASPNIKRLLKMAYNSKAYISMAIHRVGKTLFIDEFDVTSIMFQSDPRQEGYRNFIKAMLQCIEPKLESALVRRNKSRHVIQSRNLLSKFLHHSIEENPKKPIKEATEIQKPAAFSVPVSENCEAELPDPLDETQPSVRSCQQRNLIWNFEDLCMLIGTDLPIFGGYDSPGISLRLNDASKPINVLTGIDYWLDNLMSNVPEVLMCFHLEGIVQNYESVKTEDLPHLSDSKFSPSAVQTMAQNVLNFLNCNATKEGHTYWLFKEKDDDVIKLYDLTSISEGLDQQPKSASSESASQKENPFAIPVAMLLYKVAYNMSNALDSANNHANICSLLKGALNLLDQHKHAQVYCSANYLLANTFVPFALDADSPHLSEVSDEELLQPKDDKSKKSRKKKRKPQHKDAFKHEIHLDALRSPPDQSFCSPKEPLSKNLQERCEDSLQCVISALQCLEEEECLKGKCAQDTPTSAPQPDEPKLANPSRPIPMPFSPSSASSQMTLSTCENASMGEFHVSVGGLQYTVICWQQKLLLLHLQKASLIHHISARLAFQQSNFGGSLGFLKLSLQCWRTIENYLGLQKNQMHPEYQLLSLAGDNYYSLAHIETDWHKHQQDFDCVLLQQNVMDKLLNNISPTDDCECDLHPPVSLQDSFQLAYRCFECASRNSAGIVQPSFVRKLASVGNELATLQMEQGLQLYSMKCKDAADRLFDESLMSFRKSLETFDSFGDMQNVALLHNNMGRLFRISAHFVADDRTPRVISVKEQLFYKQAIEQYKLGFASLQRRESYSHIWDSLCGNYCKVLLIYGQLLVENQCDDMSPAAALIEAKQVVEDCLTMASKQHYKTSPQFKRIVIETNECLANIYLHPHFWQTRLLDADRLTLGQVHFQLASQMYIDAGEPYEAVALQTSHVTALDTLCKQGTFSSEDLMKKRIEILQVIAKQHKTVQLCAKLTRGPKRKAKQFTPTAKQLLILRSFEEKLQKSLLHVIRLNKEPCANLNADRLKQIYRQSITKVENCDLLQHLTHTINQLPELFKKDK